MMIDLTEFGPVTVGGEQEPLATRFLYFFFLAENNARQAFFECLFVGFVSLLFAEALPARRRQKSRGGSILCKPHFDRNASTKIALGNSNRLPLRTPDELIMTSWSLVSCHPMLIIMCSHLNITERAHDLPNEEDRVYLSQSSEQTPVVRTIAA